MVMQAAARIVLYDLVTVAADDLSDPFQLAGREVTINRYKISGPAG